MTINELFDGVYLAVQGSLRVMIRGNFNLIPEPIFEGTADNWRDIPDDVRNMRIGYIYPSTLREPRGQIVIEVMREDS